MKTTRMVVEDTYSHSHLPPRFMNPWFCLALALLWALGFQARAAVDWPVLGFTQVGTNSFSNPTCITHAGDGSQRLFVAERAGRILIIQNGSVLAQPFLDITDRVGSAPNGVLGLAFAPGFATNGHVYVCYVRKSDGWVAVSRFQLSADPNVADAASEEVILAPGQAYARGQGHDAGQIAFGPDGYLYVGTGDSGQQGDPQNLAQDPKSLRGKILRLDVEGGASPYAVPPGNPFAGGTNYAPEIWALGLRNPQHFSFDRLTGDLYIGDAYEVIQMNNEVNFQPAGSPGGLNYGWRIMQGPTNYMAPAGFTNLAALTLPITSYKLSDMTNSYNCIASVTGGHVYRGPGEARLDGVYFFGDYFEGYIWGMKQVGTNWQRQALLSPVYSSPFIPIISAFGEDEQGRLYLADYNRGRIFQIQDAHQVWTPVFSPTNGFIGSNSVTVSCLTPDAEIHFTTNGADPTLADPFVFSGGAIPAFTGQTNKVRAFRADLSPSAVVTAVFTNKVATPVFSPPAGPVTNGTLISFSTSTPGASLYYTTNGATPATASLLYTGPLRFGGSPLTLKVLGVAAGYTNSTIATATYSQAQAAPVVFAPAAGPITNGTSVSLSCATPASTIYYTLDGTTPGTSSLVYSGPVVINGGTTVKAFAVSAGYLNGAVQSVFYELVQTAAPVFSPSPGAVPFGTEVSVACATPGAVIYYTLDGSAPTTNSAVFSGGLPITNAVTISAFAVAAEHLDSAVTTALYTLTRVPGPTFSPSQGPLRNGARIAINGVAPGAVVYYTTDGTDPTPASAVYSGPLALTGPMTLKARAYAARFDPSDIVSAFFGLLDPRPTVVTTVAGCTNSGWTDGPGTMARFASPQALCLDASGNLLVADTGNNVIRKILPSGQVVTLVGSNGLFNTPTGLCLDSTGNLYVADSGNCNRICRIDTNGVFTVFANVTLCGPGIGNYGSGLGQIRAGPDGNLYAGYWASLRKVLPDGSVCGIAGTYCNCPGGWGVYVAPCVDAATNVYSATGGYLWQTAPDNSTTLFAGGIPAFSDGPRQLAGFYNLQDAAVDAATNLFLSDSTRIRRVSPDGWISTLAGTGVTGYRNGRGSEAQFNNAIGLSVDTQGNIYVADAGNNCIRKISPDTAAIGIADDWQLAHFGYIGIDPNADPDHDGLSNYAEFWAGTDPLDAGSSLAIQRAGLADNDQVQIRWQTVAGKTYCVQYSSDLLSWTDLASAVQGDGSMAVVTDAAQMSQTEHRFYRIALTGF